MELEVPLHVTAQRVHAQLDDPIAPLHHEVLLEELLVLLHAVLLLVDREEAGLVQRLEPDEGGS